MRCRCGWSRVCACACVRRRAEARHPARLSTSSVRWSSRDGRGRRRGRPSPPASGETGRRRTVPALVDGRQRLPAHRDLGAVDRRDAGGAGGMGELHRAGHGVVIGEGERQMAEIARLLGELGRQRGTVEERVRRVRVELHVGTSAGGRLGRRHDRTHVRMLGGRAPAETPVTGRDMTAAHRRMSSTDRRKTSAPMLVTERYASGCRYAWSPAGGLRMAPLASLNLSLKGMARCPSRSHRTIRGAPPVALARRVACPPPPSPVPRGCRQHRDCPAQPTTKAFEKWGDTADYALDPRRRLRVRHVRLDLHQRARSPTGNETSGVLPGARSVADGHNWFVTARRARRPRRWFCVTRRPPVLPLPAQGQRRRSASWRPSSATRTHRQAGPAAGAVEGQHQPLPGQVEAVGAQPALGQPAARRGRDASACSSSSSRRAACSARATASTTSSWIRTAGAEHLALTAVLGPAPARRSVTRRLAEPLRRRRPIRRLGVPTRAIPRGRISSATRPRIHRNSRHPGFPGLRPISVHPRPHERLSERESASWVQLSGPR